MKGVYLVLLLGITFGFSAQKYSVGFYNVENLFDTIDDPHKNDNEFLPSSKHEWNSQKYFEKLKHINEVLDEMGALLAVGFCEIENKTVIEDVVKNSNREHFQIVHYESADERGIDVGMIYNPDKLKLMQSGNIRFILPGRDKASTRDIVWGKFLSKKDTVFIFVNHWPSRLGGEEKTDPYRLEAAKNARHFIDSVQLISPNSKLILMGDLNDYPSNNAPKLIAEKLTPVIKHESGEFGGTHFYSKNWEVLDHIFMSQNLLTKKGFRATENSGKILSPSFLIEEHKGVKKPFRTYASQKYLGGYSDHLPVILKVNL